MVPLEFLSEVINKTILASPLDGTWLGKHNQNSFPLFEKSWAADFLPANNRIIRLASKHDFLIECRACFRCDEFTEKRPPKFIARDNAFDILITDLQKGNWDFGLEVEEFPKDITLDDKSIFFSL